jgi:chromosome partitioning protein
MIVALLNQRHGAGKTTLALHLAGVGACQTRHVTVIDADPQGCALEWSEMRAQKPLPTRFTVIGLTPNTLHREAPNIARDVDRVIVDGPSDITARTRSALLSADLMVVPVQLPPSVRAAFAETLRLVNEANTFRPQLRILNRCDVRAVDAREIARAGADKLHRPARRPRRRGTDRPARLRNGPQRSSLPGDHRARCRSRKDRAMTGRDPNSAFVICTRSPDTWIGERNTNASMNLAKPDPRASRTTIDTTVLRPRTKIGPFWCGDAVATASNHSVNLSTSHVRDKA